MFTKQMISSEIPMLMSKACEIFIQELTFRAWMHAEKNNKSIVQPCDVAKVIMQTDTMNFLTEIIPNNLGDFSVFDAKVSSFFSSSFVSSYTFHIHSMTSLIYHLWECINIKLNKTILVLVVTLFDNC